MTGKKIIQHRANSLLNLRFQPPVVDYAEIDVHVGIDGKVVVRHDPDDQWGEYNAIEYLRRAPFKGYLVDIKQNLEVKYLKRIQEVFKDKLLAFIDIPWPSLHFALQDSSLPILGRLSYYEPYNLRYNAFWLDPLRDCEVDSYVDLLNDIHYSKKAIVAMPSLYGKGLDEDLEVYKVLAEKYQVDGVVTKFPKELSCFKL